MEKKINVFKELAKDNESRQKKRQEKISKLQTECSNAETALAKANADYEKAKEKLDSASMIEAKKEAAAAEEVVNMFKEALDSELKQAAYSPEEADRAVRDIQKYVEEVNDAASMEVCKLLIPVRQLIEDTEKIMENCNCLIMDIAGDNIHYQRAKLNTLLNNIRLEIANEERTFKQYFPAK